MFKLNNRPEQYASDVWADTAYHFPRRTPPALANPPQEAER
jgi:hypothetical protein